WAAWGSRSSTASPSGTTRRSSSASSSRSPWPGWRICCWSARSAWPSPGRARAGRRVVPEVHFLSQVFDWFTTSSNWTGASGIPTLLWRQLELSLTVVATAVALGGGLGMVLGHTGRGGLVAVNAANAFRAVPSLALLTL